MVEFLVGIAVVLLAGYIIAHNHHRIRSLAVAVSAGILVGEAIPDVSESSHHHWHDEGNPHLDDGHTHDGGGNAHDGDSLAS